MQTLGSPGVALWSADWRIPAICLGFGEVTLLK